MTDISDLAVQFESVFGVRLSKYWLGPLRLDIVKFDNEVIHSGCRAMKEVVLEKYGQGAVDLLKALM